MLDMHIRGHLFARTITKAKNMENAKHIRKSGKQMN
jgi:hypothetical protein